MRNRIEAAFGRLGHRIHRRAWWVIVAALLLVAAAATQIPKVEFVASADNFLRPDDPVRVTYDEFLEQFGRDDTLILAIEPPEVFDLAFLEKLRRFHRDLERELPHVREVQSLINARHTRGEGDRLVVGDLFEDWPESAEELAVLRARALGNPLYRNVLLSLDAKLTTLVIELEAFSGPGSIDDALAGFDDDDDEAGTSTGAPDDAPPSLAKLSGNQERAVVAATYAVMARYQAPDFRIYAAGASFINTDLVSSMMSDVVRFTAMSLLVIALVLAVVFRRLAAVVVPLLLATLSLTSTIGMMGALGIAFMPLSETIPSFLLSVGVGGTVHLLVIFLQRLRAGATREDALAGALSHSGLPIAMTSLTTAAGLASFGAAEMVPIAVFGTVAPMGVLMTLVLTLTLAPALIAVIPMTAAQGARSEAPLSIRLLTACGSFATRRPALVLGVSALLLAVSLGGIARLSMTHNPLDWFPDDTPVKIATLKLDREMGGGMSLEFLVDTQRENGLYDPAVLKQLDAISQAASELRVDDVWVGKSVSLVDVVKEIHLALNAHDPAAYAVPANRRLIAQELLLFENSGSDDLEDVVDPQFSIGRLTMKVPFVDGAHYVEFGKVANDTFAGILGPQTKLTLTGLMAVMGRTLSAAIETMMQSYLIALAIITPLMMLVLGSVRLGLIAMIPNLFPIVLTLGVMGWVGLPLEMFSLLIGSIALGLAVDDTIHFMHGFRSAYMRSGDVEQSVRETLETTGQALLFTSVVLSLGFFIYVFSALTNLTSFGALTAFAIVMAFAADILMAPALMALLTRFSSLDRSRAR